MNSIILRTYNCLWGGGREIESLCSFVYTSAKAVLVKECESEYQFSILVDKFSQSRFLVNWHYGKMHFSSSLNCIAHCASTNWYIYYCFANLGGESFFKFYWKLNCIITALIMHVLTTKCTLIDENVLSQHKFGGAFRFCFEPFLRGEGGVK